MQQSKALYINGDGKNTRDFCFVRDVVQALLLGSTALNSVAFGTSFNVGLGKARDLNESFYIIRTLVEA
jgi:UDP-N-acetylglucosamine 4-epimerase